MTVAEEAVIAELRTWNRRKAPPTFRQFAATLRLPGGPQVGQPYNPSSDPAQSYLIDQMDSGEWERIYWSGSPQTSGKTLVAVMLPALRGAIACGLPIGYGLPTLQDLDKAWSTKLKPAITRSGYRSHLPQHGPGSKGGRGPTLNFVDPATGDTLGGIVFMAGGAYGDTVAAAIVDEIDTFRDADGTPQWKGIEDIFARAKSYGRRALRIGVGTVEPGAESIILTLINVHGTGTRCWQRCPHCGAYQVVTRAQITYHYLLQGAIGQQSIDEQAVRESARIVCTRCAVGWTNSDRLASLEASRFAHRGQLVDDEGIIQGPAPRTSRLGLLTPAWATTLADLTEIALDHASARLMEETTHNHDLMAEWVRYIACEQDTGGSRSDIPQTTDLQLAARAQREAHQRGAIPEAVDVITIGADTGKREAWWLSLAMDARFRWWIIDWSVKTTGDHRAEPTPTQQVDMLDHLLERAGRVGRADAIGIDVGYNKDLVTAWARQNRIRLVRGDQRPTGRRDEDRNKLLPSWADDRTQTDGSHWLFLDGAVIKAEIQKALAREPDADGAGHIPQGQEAGDWLIRHITSEVWEPKNRCWVKRPGRDNHLLDCLVYAYALAVIALRARHARPTAPQAAKDDDDDFGNAVW